MQKLSEKPLLPFFFHSFLLALIPALSLVRPFNQMIPQPIQNETNKQLSTSRLAPWDISTADFGIFVSMAFMFIFIGSAIGVKLLEWVPLIKRLSTDDLLGVILSGYGLQIGAITAFVLFSKYVPSSNNNRPVPIRKAISVGLIALLVSYCGLMAFIPLWKLSLEFLRIPFQLQEPVLMLLQGGSTLEMVLMYILIVIGAPLGEELLFRAGIFRFLDSRIGMPAAAFISSLFFGIVHWNTYSFGPLLLLGCALCFIYKKTGSILSSMTLHASFNLTNLIFISLTQGGIAS